MARTRIPKFQNEAEEAEWWDKNRDKLDKDFLVAASEGRLGRLTKEKLRARIAKSTRVISIRIAEEDLSLARQQAAAKGLPYQTYIKSLLHEGLRKKERPEPTRTRRPVRRVPAVDRSAELQWLQEQSSDFAGEWVALEGATVLAHGSDFDEVFSEAERLSKKTPFVIQVESLDSLPFAGW